MISKENKGSEKLYYSKVDLLTELNMNSGVRLDATYSLNIKLSQDSLIRKSHDIIDIFIEKIDIFGATLHPYYKLAGSGFYGGLAIIFSITISYILQIYLVPNLLINS